MLDDGCVALVHDLDEFGLGYQPTRERDWVLADLKVLFTMEEHHRVEVGDKRVETERGFGIEGWDDTVCWEDLEIFGSLAKQ